MRAAPARIYSHTVRTRASLCLAAIVKGGPADIEISEPTVGSLASYLASRREMTSLGALMPSLGVSSQDFRRAGFGSPAPFFPGVQGSPPDPAVSTCLEMGEGEL